MADEEDREHEQDDRIAEDDRLGNRRNDEVEMNERLSLIEVGGNEREAGGHIIGSKRGEPGQRAERWRRVGARA